MVTNALSVDVEEYYHAAIFRTGTRGGNSSAHYESRVEESMELLLALLRMHRTKATFFTLGEVAAAHPALIRRMAAEGHEVACHGDRHDDVYRLATEEFRMDIRRAKRQLEDIIGDSVIGYRAPNFSIGPEQSWAYQVLMEEGFRYDSSMYPIVHDRYGQPSAPRFPYEIRRDGAASLIEFPIGTLRMCGVNLPIGGGGYFRLSPFSVTRFAIQRVNDHEQRPVMFYLHPWELDTAQPRPPMAWRHRFRHYVGLETETSKLGRLLSRFRFGTAREVLLAHASWPGLLGAVPVAAELQTLPS
jgi:polysaccharide deacetylase family protein (PEP-CTERM system associated)